MHLVFMNAFQYVSNFQILWRNLTLVSYFIISLVKNLEWPAINKSSKNRVHIIMAICVVEMTNARKIITSFCKILA
jgi:hypothetical protein